MRSIFYSLLIIWIINSCAVGYAADASLQVQPRWSSGSYEHSVLLDFVKNNPEMRIFYTFDPHQPLTEATEFTAPLKILGNTSVWYFGFLDEQHVTPFAEVKYTINNPEEPRWTYATMMARTVRIEEYKWEGADLVVRGESYPNAEYSYSLSGESINVGSFRADAWGHWEKRWRDLRPGLYTFVPCYAESGEVSCGLETNLKQSSVGTIGFWDWLVPTANAADGDPINWQSASLLSFSADASLLISLWIVFMGLTVVSYLPLLYKK